jgi:dihydrofolate synthase/folylpolyglutamate synthase
MVVIEAKARGQGSALTVLAEPCQGAVGLLGDHQKWNAAVALAALDAAKLVPDQSARARGLASVQWPARFQRLGSNLVIDGAHNVPAAQALAVTWREVFGAVRPRLVFGALREKNPEELLRVLHDIADEIVLVPVGNARAASIAQLREAAQNCGFTAIIESALADALKSRNRQPLLVTGSLFLAGEALALLEGSPPPARSSQ